MAKSKGGQQHRPTLKTTHKPFKSRHSSKGYVKSQSKGRVEKGGGYSKRQRDLSKVERKNLAKQLRHNKISESQEARKLFEGVNGAEKVVTVVGLTSDVLASEIARRLIDIVQEQDEDLEKLLEPSCTKIRINRFKSNLRLIVPDHTNLINILDAAKVSDFVVVGISALQEVERYHGEEILRSLLAQGVASVVGVMPNLLSAYHKKNLQADIKQSLHSYFTHFFADEEKLFALENPNECLNCIRTLCQKFPKSIAWRDRRGYMVADTVSFSPSNMNPDEGSLIVEGTVRGSGFHANRLVHIPAIGDLQIESMERLGPNVVKKEVDMDTDESNIFNADENRETLEELSPDNPEMEDDWTDVSDLVGISMEGKHYFENDPVTNSNRKYKVPKGTSEYQARWLLDDVLEGASDVESEGDVDSEDKAMSSDDNLEMDSETPQGVEQEDIGGDVDDSNGMYVDLSPEEEQRQLEEQREIVKDDIEFPDEYELEPSESAREKFRGFKGVKSLANCDWDYDEKTSERPDCWKRLLRIPNFKATKNKVIKDASNDVQVRLGERVRILIKVSCSSVAKFTNDLPIAIFELFPHEHKHTVLNYSFVSWEDYTESIPSGEKLIMQCGPRRHVVYPLFSQDSLTPNNVHKMERFHHQGTESIATCIGPVLFHNAPTIFFKQNPDNSLQCVGQGTLLNTDYTRIVAERVTLTGYPVKIHKRVVTVRYMFFNPEDVNWFKAVPLFTKDGRHGYIQESLGTHGYFKATFDGRLTSQDTVAMSIYKRAWPSMSQLYA